MPRGTYHHLDPGGTLAGVEVFSCAPGPAGWRYVSQTYDAENRPLGRVDVTVDDRWRQVRVQVTSGAWTLRGGLAGPEAVWVRVPAEDAEGPGAHAAGAAEQAATAAGFTGRSPAFAVATARLLGLGLLDRRRVRLVGVTEPACVALPVDEGWALVDVEEHATDTAPLRVERYEVADLATAERRVVHLAGDVVLEAPGLELANLESPPTQ
ncbi:MAG: hypothetical protein QOE45_1014 [Frankiaceae bacterium]|jgi:hypothetical protein|nr:hypothetical protein [Frankiaceae bacterium]